MSLLAPRDNRIQKTDTKPYPNLFEDLKVDSITANTFTINQYITNDLTVNNSALADGGNFNIIAVPTGSDTFLDITDNINPPIGFTKPNASTYIYSGSKAKVFVMVFAQVEAEKVSTNTNCQLRICKQLTVGGYQVMATSTQWVDKTEGHLITCQYVMALNQGEGIRLAVRPDAGACQLSPSPAIGSPPLISGSVRMTLHELYTPVPV